MTLHGQILTKELASVEKDKEKSNSDLSSYYNTDVEQTMNNDLFETVRTEKRRNPLPLRQKPSLTNQRPLSHRATSVGSKKVKTKTRVCNSPKVKP